MSIEIDWIDRNASVDSFKIYRSSSPILENALPAALTSVTGNVFKYVDTTAPRNTVFHYRVATVVGGVETLSSNRPLANIPYSGPGPQKLVRGDYLFGLYGRMNIEDLISATDLCRFMGWPISSAQSTVKYWIKYVLNGKILFTPDNAIANNVPGGLRGLYALGAMYGNDATNTHMPALVALNGVVPQRCMLTIGEHQLLVRLPASRVGAPPATYSDATAVGGEWDQSIAPMFMGRQTTNLVQTYDDQQFIPSQYYYTKDSQSTNGTAVVCRGGTQYPDGVYTPGLENAAGPLPSHFWKPVLELQM